MADTIKKESKLLSNMPGINVNTNTVPVQQTSSNKTSSVSVFNNNTNENNVVNTPQIAYDSEENIEFDAEIYDRNKAQYKKNYENHRHATIVNVDANSSTQDIIRELNAAGKERNEKQAEESVIHGMAEEEYDAYQEFLYEEHGIVTDSDYHESVATSMGYSCGEYSPRYMAACKTATSMDSVLDSVLTLKLRDAMQELYGDGLLNWDSMVDNQKLLARGIQVTRVGDEKSQQFSISMVDENGHIIQDEDGHLAQLYSADFLMPDGLAQHNELFIAEMLDGMGFDCRSIIDYSKEEREMIEELAKLDVSQLGTSSNISGKDYNAINREVLGVCDEETNRWSKVNYQDNSAWKTGTYVDTVTGDVTGQKKYKKVFEKRRDTSDYFVKKREHTGKGAYVSAGHGSSSSSSSEYGSTSASDGSYNGTTSDSDDLDQTMISNTNTSDMITDSQKASSETSSKENQTDDIKSVNLAQFDKIVEQMAKENYCSQTIAVELAMKKYSVIGMNKNGVLEHFRKKEKEQQLA